MFIYFLKVTEYLLVTYIKKKFEFPKEYIVNKDYYKLLLSSPVLSCLRYKLLYT